MTDKSTTPDFDTLVAATTIKVSLTLGEDVKSEDVERVTDAYLLFRKHMSTLCTRAGCRGRFWTGPDCKCYAHDEHVAWEAIRAVLEE